MTAPRRERLGRGLGALLGEYLGEPAGGGEVRTLPVRAIAPNPLQPRRDFAPEELAELTASIRTNGLLQPLLVRPDPAGRDRYQLVAGERRLRAITGLGWEEVPAVIRDVDDETLLVLALVENIQRAALSPLDEAEGYRMLGERFGLAPADVAKAVGKDRSTVANALRLLRLPPSVRRLVESGSLSAGHARPLLTLDDPTQAADLARRAVADGWSVREVEKRARALRSRGTGGTEPRKSSVKVDPTVRVLQQELQAALGTRVSLKGSTSSGTIEIPFASGDELERLFALLTGREASEMLG